MICLTPGEQYRCVDLNPRIQGLILIRELLNIFKKCNIFLRKENVSSLRFSLMFLICSFKKRH